MYQSGLVYGESEMPDCQLIGFVRDPILRLKSAWRYFSPKGNAGIRKNSTWPEYVDDVLGGLTNPHWLPVHSSYRTEVLYPYEYLEDIWNSIGFPPLPIFKPTDRTMPAPDHRLDELHELYAADLELRKCL